MTITNSSDAGVIGPDVERTLDAVGRLVRRRMLDAIPDGEPSRWLYAIAREYPSRPGKALRPSLALATAMAFGGTADDVLPAAVAIELLHNAFLIHDDIADGSERRRGRPTLHDTHGVGLAINAGDALATLANQLLRRQARTMEPALADRLFEEFETMALRTLEGQATEIGWQTDAVSSVTADDYLALIMHKSCWYTTIHPLRVGALLGSRGHADLRTMVRFGFYLGAAFQIRDDLLNLTGDEALYGKEINGDLAEGKRTLPLIHLIEHAVGADRDLVDGYLARRRADRSPALVAELRQLMDDYHSIEFTVEYGLGIAAAAYDAFEEAFAGTGGPGADFVRHLIAHMLGRDR